MGIVNLTNQFIQEYGTNNQPIHCFFAPGRVNLIGEHVDYNGGSVFPAALSLGIWGALRFRADNLIQLRSTNAVLPVTVTLSEPVVYDEQDGWGNYPKGVIKYLQQSGLGLKGCDILFSGNLSYGAGLSSSAAILVLTAFMLRHTLGDTDIDRPELAKFCRDVENQFVGINCGIMDQFSVAMGRKDCAIFLDCKTLNFQYVPLVLEKYQLVIMNTSKKRELASSTYNQRRSECEQVLDIIKRYRPITNLCQASFTDVEKYIEDEVLARRAKHVVSEQNRVLMAVDLLKQGDITGFGRLMTKSHMSLKDDYEVSGPELDSIVHHALKAEGCIGARMTGAGFGGCAIALVDKERLEDFKTAVACGYNKSTGLIPDFYSAEISDGVKTVAGSGTL